jgi:hypothetical protein
MRLPASFHRENGTLRSTSSLTVNRSARATPVTQKFFSAGTDAFPVARSTFAFQFDDGIEARRKKRPVLKVK